MSRKRARSRRPSPPKPQAEAPPVVSHDPATWGFNKLALSLAVNKAEVRQEGASRKHVERATRLDVFAMLKQRRDADGAPGLETSHYESVRRLETDYHLAAGVEGVSDTASRVSAGGCQEQVTQRMVDASARVKWITGYMPTHHAQLAPLLLDPTHNGALISRWRGHVERVTGITDKQAQADTARWFAAAVHEAYVALDYGATHHRLTNRPRYGT